ncbi:hypothetical protein HPB51_008883 [Rhipicephalus microplus]|uniref:Uncharacterized protein n=1 Tax=Rhipicephalus microplus TaxID=6941 RepID=A0A9J6D9A3_RHIMP|nr:hypothetical protein HPB51_008883 [Rhipicephalus microplus]
MAMANSDHLQKQRGSIRSLVTRALTLLTDLLQQPNPDASQINVHMGYLKDNEAVLSNLDDIILVTTDQEILDHEVGTAQEYNEKILYAVSHAKFWLQERERTDRTQAQATEPGPSYLGSLNSADAAGQGTERRQHPVQLPKLQIPTFNGSLRGWQSFWGHFDVIPSTRIPSCRASKNLSTASPTEHEASCRRHPSSRTKLRPCNQNLHGRFGRKNLLIKQHVDHILTLSPVKTSSEAPKLRLLHDSVQCHFSALEGLGVAADQYAVVLNYVFMLCLPEDLAIVYRQKSKESNGASSIAVTPENRTRLAKELLTFIRIQEKSGRRAGYSLVVRRKTNRNVCRGTHTISVSTNRIYIPCQTAVLAMSSQRSCYHWFDHAITGCVYFMIEAALRWH